MKLTYSIILLLFCTSILYGQTDEILVTDSTMLNRLENLVTVENLKKHVKTLSSDKMKGRSPLTGGEKMAADYISNYYTISGIEKYGDSRSQSFFTFILQPVKFTISNKNAILNKTNFDVLSREFSFKGDIDIVYMDKLSMENVYRRKVKNQIVAYSERYNPFNKENDIKIEDIPAKIFLSINDDEYHTKNNDFKGVNNSFQFSTLDPAKVKSTGKDNLYVFSNWINFLSLFSEEQQKMISKFNRLKKKDQKLLRTTVHADIEIKNVEYENENILAYVEGSELKDEIILVHANYDNIGMQKGVVFNGANSNATGTAAVMELANIMMQAKKLGMGPKRSILFVNFAASSFVKTGELYFCERSGFPKEKIIANISFNQLGGIKEGAEQEPNYISLFGLDGHSTKYSNIIKKVADNQELAYNIIESGYGYQKSARGPLVYSGIPTTILGDQSEKFIRQPLDDYENVNFDLVYKRTLLGLALIWELANRSDHYENDIFVPNPHYPEKSIY